jgi:lysine 2,3-aminomutase
MSSESWLREVTTGARAVSELVSLGHVGANDAAALEAVAARFEMWVSRYYLSLIDRADPQCPIRKQALPHPDELLALPTELTDPIGDLAHRQPPVVIHRYPDRALLFPTLRCPMFCRYCFRKVYLNEEDPIRLSQDLDRAIAYITAQEGIREVILSGGDPLLLTDTRLAGLLGRLRAIPHVRRLRIHTRVPATLPMRLTTELGGVLSAAGPLTVVSHFNHPRELTAQAIEGTRTLRMAGVPLANQSVLLRGVNDDTDTLRALFEGLLDMGVRPYYLHHPDLTVGTQHFRVSLDEGLELTRALRGRQSGLAIPHYVVEIPGGHGKVLVDSASVVRTERRGVWRMTSPKGTQHTYVDPAVWPQGIGAENDPD